jgi:hypothetical protein
MKALVQYRRGGQDEYDVDELLAAVRNILTNPKIDEFNIDIRRRRAGVTFRVYPTVGALWRTWRRRHKK